MLLGADNASRLPVNPCVDDGFAIPRGISSAPSRLEIHPMPSDSLMLLTLLPRRGLRATAACLTRRGLNSTAGCMPRRVLTRVLVHLPKRGLGAWSLTSSLLVLLMSLGGRVPLLLLLGLLLLHLAA